MLRADGEVVWSWHTKAGVKLATMLCIAPMTEATKPGLRGEREGNRKTIARGMSCEAALPVVTSACVSFLFARKAMGASSAPGIPRALCWFRGTLFFARLGRIAPREYALVSRTRRSASLAVRRRAGTHKGMKQTDGPRLSSAPLSCCAASGARGRWRDSTTPSSFPAPSPAAPARSAPAPRSERRHARTCRKEG